MQGVEIPISRTKLGVASKRNKFEGFAMRTAIHGVSIRGIPTVDNLINIFPDDRSGFYTVFNDFIIDFEHLLYHIHELIMK